MPWQKGQSGNKNGRPKKGMCYADMLEKAVKSLKSVQKDKEGKVVGEYKGKMVLAMATVDLATNKTYPPQVRLQAIKEIYDRTDGKPAQSVQLEADVEQTIIKNNVADLQKEIDKLTPEERELYFELCEKVNGEVE